MATAVMANMRGSRFIQGERVMVFLPEISVSRIQRLLVRVALVGLPLRVMVFELGRLGSSMRAGMFAGRVMFRVKVFSFFQSMRMGP